MSFVLLSLLMAFNLMNGMLDSPAVSVGRFHENNNYVEICSGIAVSPSHAVTLHAFTRGNDPFLILKGNRIYPDSVIPFRDMGLSLLVFADSVFNAYEQPRNTSPPNGAALMIVANHPTGISVVQTFPMEQLDDGALLLAASPSSELMGAPVFDSYNALAGIVAGSFDPQDGRGELLALVPSSLWYFWIETFLADAGMSTPEFGVTAMPATSGLSEVHGILILDVQTGSTAWESGLREGDIVTTINGEHVYHPEALKVMVQNTTEELTLHVQRDSEKVLVVIPGR
ncbi:hypothetical protein CSA37_12060 [Candidatus Fermentibacteria bacterium]|nr:MAG: hypothetical protein CSA37_12060 [Candidatus Fermentibacteria bacterium]